MASSSDSTHNVERILCVIEFGIRNSSPLLLLSPRSSLRSPLRPLRSLTPDPRSRFGDFSPSHLDIDANEGRKVSREVRVSERRDSVQITPLYTSIVLICINLIMIRRDLFHTDQVADLCVIHAPGCASASFLSAITQLITVLQWTTTAEIPEG